MLRGSSGTLLVVFEDKVETKVKIQRRPYFQGGHLANSISREILNKHSHYTSDLKKNHVLQQLHINYTA